MPFKDKLKHILAELKGHAPFTAVGALTGLAFMLIFNKMGQPHARILFSIFHPSHVLLSAMVTASMFILHKKRKSFFYILLIGYVGSIGIATLSDSIIPFIGERFLGLDIPTHSHSHSEVDHEQQHLDSEHEHHAELHLGFIEEWYIVHPVAVLGVLIAYFLPHTKFPHAGHILISTWASSAHILMNRAGDMTAGAIVSIFVILFIAVWLPCCVSDIVFPLLFVDSDLKLNGQCLCHERHSHSHRE